MVGCHSEVATSGCGYGDPLSVGAFDPVFDGLEERFLSFRVDADDAEVRVGILDGEGAIIIDEFFVSAVVEFIVDEVLDGGGVKSLGMGVPKSDVFGAGKAVAAFGGMPVRMSEADFGFGEADDATNNTGAGVGGDTEDEVAEEVIAGFDLVVGV